MAASRDVGFPRRVSFHTLGCKLNQCETAQMEESLAGEGWEIVPWEAPASVRVLNTCTVTSKTDRECRRLIRRAKRLDPGSRVVVTGCYAHVAADTVGAIPGVELVLGNLDKFALAEHLEGLVEHAPNGCTALTAVTPYSSACTAPGQGPGEAIAAPGPAPAEGEFITHFSGYTRAFLKVQNGCNSRCSYCIIPEARGPSRSMPLEDVLAQVRLLDERGFREVVLTGIHIGAWGRDTGEGDLADLLQAVLERTALGRLRLSSTEPMEVTDRVLSVAAEGGGRFAAHFHVPLQSGSDTVLRRMNRPYDAERYRERVEAIRSAFPDAAIGADVIVGFPGETETEFAETMALVGELPLTYLHVFAYSDRRGTRASEMAGKVAPEVTHERSARLRGLADDKNAAFQAGFRGRELEALVLGQETADGQRVAVTGNYLELALPAEAAPENRFVWAIPRERRDDGRWQTEVRSVSDR